MKKITLSLFILGAFLFAGERSLANHQINFPGIKTYENIAMFHGSNVILSWIDNDMVSQKDILSSVGSDRLEVLSEESELGIKEFNDEKGNRIIFIKGRGETLLLTYIPGKIKRPSNLLEFKVEDEIISMEQLAYVTEVVKKEG